MKPDWQDYTIFCITLVGSAVFVFGITQGWWG